MLEPFVDIEWISTGSKLGDDDRAIECIVNKLARLKELEIAAAEMPELLRQILECESALTHLVARVGAQEYFMFYYKADTELRKLDGMIA